ncbi:hypothetical protein ABBQ32_008527 [Trebouxia sp. C0010 RCD-2024]
MSVTTVPAHDDCQPGTIGSGLLRPVVAALASASASFKASDVPVSAASCDRSCALCGHAGSTAAGSKSNIRCDQFQLLIVFATEGRLACRHRAMGRLSKAERHCQVPKTTIYPTSSQQIRTQIVSVVLPAVHMCQACLTQ